MIGLVQFFYDLLGIGLQANWGDVWGALFLDITLLCALFKLLPVGRTPPTPFEPAISIEKTGEEPSWGERLNRGLSRSRREFWGKLSQIFSSKDELRDSLDDVEELLYGADLGPAMVDELIRQLQGKLSASSDFGKDDFKELLFSFLKGRMEPVQSGLKTSLHRFDPSRRGETQVVMMTGVNGAGKTTTIGKLATRLAGEGAKIVVGACDTFRAAAVEQLEHWCKRAGVEMVRGKEGAAPSGVGHEALERALKTKADYCLIDTAGRLHTKSNLMDEITKCKNVLTRLHPQAPHEVILVIDAITGQNALRQAEEFHRALNLTGLILTKCDSSSKAGGAVGIVQKLQCPIVSIGVGEKVGDLNIFRLEEYLNALLVDET